MHAGLFNSRLSICYLDKVKFLQCHDKRLRGSGALALARSCAADATLSEGWEGRIDGSTAAHTKAVNVLDRITPPIDLR